MFSTFPRCRSHLRLVAFEWLSFAQVTSATIVGNVTDSSGAAIEGVNITATKTPQGIHERHERSPGERRLAISIGPKCFSLVYDTPKVSDYLGGSRAMSLVTDGW